MMHNAQKHLKYELGHCSVTRWIDCYLKNVLLVKSPGSRVRSRCPQSPRRLWNWKTLCWSKSELAQHAPTWQLCQMQTHTRRCTHTKSLFSFPRGEALVQGWPLYHNRLIRFASLRLSLSVWVCSLHHSPFVAPLNRQSQTFVFFCEQMQLLHLCSTVFISFSSCRPSDRSLFYSCSTDKFPTCDSACCSNFAFFFLFLLCHPPKVSWLLCFPFNLLSASLPLHWLNFLSSLSQIQLQPWLHWPFHWAYMWHITRHFCSCSLLFHYKKLNLKGKGGRFDTRWIILTSILALIHAWGGDYNYISRVMSQFNISDDLF